LTVHVYDRTAIPQTPTLSKNEWVSVLKLANLWDFVEVRNLAIEQLTSHAGSLDCIERILFARQFDVSAWLQSGYVELARRKAFISSEEAEKIGWKTALQICELREAKTVSTFSGKNPYEQINLGDTFQAELKRADAAHEPLPAISPALASSSKAASPDTDPGPKKAAFTFNFGSSDTSAPSGSDTPATEPATTAITTTTSTFSFGPPPPAATGTVAPLPFSFGSSKGFLATPPSTIPTYTSTPIGSASGTPSTSANVSDAPTGRSGSRRTIRVRLPSPASATSPVTGGASASPDASTTASASPSSTCKATSPPTT
jgi:hypothetical protein